jgi:hypothetical protein
VPGQSRPQRLTFRGRASRAVSLLLACCMLEEISYLMKAVERAKENDDRLLGQNTRDGEP